MLLELLVAAAIIGLALLPLLQLFPTILAPLPVSDVELRLDGAAIRKSEELVNRLRFDIAGAASGTETCTDVPSCLLVWTITTEQASAVPGVGVLRIIDVVACQDRDGSGACEPAEDQVRLSSKATSRP